MNFINPFFLLGTLVASVPILLHLMKRSQARRIEYPSLMFLRKISRRYIRFQKLRHLLLLLMRILALVLLALAFTRPYLEISDSAMASGPGSTAHIVLLDNSLSMGYEDRWARARSEAARIARSVRSGDKLALLEFADQTLVAVPFTEDPAQILAYLEKATEPSDRSTRYAQVLRAAERLALDSGTARRTIHLISDFQKTGMAADEQNFQIGSGIELEGTDLGDDTFANLAIADVQVLEDSGSGDGRLRVKPSILRLGSGELPEARVFLMLGDRKIGEKTIDPAGGSPQSVEFTLPVLGEGTHEIAVQVDDPALPRDNRFLLRLSVQGKRPVLAVEGAVRAGRSPTSYVEAAINASALSPYRLTRMSVRQFEAAEKVPADLLIWNCASGAGEQARSRLERFVKDGGGLAIVAEDHRCAADFNRLFSSWLSVSLDGAPGSTGARPRPGEDFRFLTDLSMDHPVFTPFRGAVSGAFSTTRFYTHARLSALGEASVLARFDNGDPALVHAESGKGKVLIFCSSADDTGNDLPLKTVYAPLWQQMLRFLENFREDRLWYLVGDTAAPRKVLADAASVSGTGELDPSQAVVVVDPSKRRVAMDPESDSIILTQAGFYEIRAERANTRIAVNVPPGESDLSHANSEELIAGWNQRTSDAPWSAEASDPPTPDEQDKQRNLWRLLVLAALVFLLGEGFLSNRLTVEQG